MILGECIVYDCQKDMLERLTAAGGPVNCVHGMALSMSTWENFERFVAAKGHVEDTILGVKNINGVPFVVVLWLKLDVVFFTDPAVWQSFLRYTDD